MCSVHRDLESVWSEMTLNYQIIVEGYPNLKEEVGGSIPDCEISSLLDEKNLPGGEQPHVLLRWPVDLLFQKEKEKRLGSESECRLHTLTNSQKPGTNTSLPGSY